MYRALGSNGVIDETLTRLLPNMYFKNEYRKIYSYLKKISSGVDEIDITSIDTIKLLSARVKAEYMLARVEREIIKLNKYGMNAKKRIDFFRKMRYILGEIISGLNRMLITTRDIDNLNIARKEQEFREILSEFTKLINQATKFDIVDVKEIAINSGIIAILIVILVPIIIIAKKYRDQIKKIMGTRKIRRSKKEKS